MVADVVVIIIVHYQEVRHCAQPGTPAPPDCKRPMAIGTSTTYALALISEYSAKMYIYISARFYIATTMAAATVARLLRLLHASLNK